MTKDANFRWNAYATNVTAVQHFTNNCFVSEPTLVPKLANSERTPDPVLIAYYTLSFVSLLYATKAARKHQNSNRKDPICLEE